MLQRNGQANAGKIRIRPLRQVRNKLASRSNNLGDNAERLALENDRVKSYCRFDGLVKVVSRIRLRQIQALFSQRQKDWYGDKQQQKSHAIQAA